jgi:hypothetical protein
MAMAVLLKEPFVHFCVLGAALFGLWALTRSEDEAASAPAREVVFLSSDVVDGAKMDFSEVQGRDPDEEELAALIQERITEEILYREGRALGLDKGDPIVRRRVVQKMRYLLEEGAQVAAPSAADVEAWIAARRTGTVASVALTHVFFDKSRRTNAEDDATLGLDAVSGGADLPPGGDPTVFGSELTLRPLPRYRREFGPAFADGIADLAVGEWSLVPSTFGWHVVRIDERTDAAAADDTYLRDQAVWALQQQARDAAVAAQAAELRVRYDVTVEGRE